MGENESASSFKAISIKDLEDLETTFRPEECIYKAPAAIRNLNEAAYTPQEISIGPFHHGRKKLKHMEREKLMYLKEFCKRLRGQTEEQVDKSLNELRRTIEDRKDAIKRSYADSYRNIKWDNDQFGQMILMDAVFIIELFLKTKEDSGDRTMYQYDVIIGKPLLRAAIQRDLILLENQLPFFILEELYNHATDYRAGYPPFLDLSCHYFENYSKNKTMQYKPLHFTDLVRYFLSFKHPTLEPPDRKQYKPLHFTDLVRNCLPFKQIKNLYNATRLHQAGLKFRANLRAECLLDIRAWDDENVNPAIKEGELHMPPLEIDNCTEFECLFRNLMALEQCHYPGQEFICRYVKLLDFLVVVEEDVDLLFENEVIVCRLGDSKAVARLIKKLCQVEVTSSYDALSDLLNNYYESSWKKYLVYVWSGAGTVIGLTRSIARCAGFGFFFI